MMPTRSIPLRHIVLSLAALSAIAVTGLAAAIANAAAPDAKSAILARQEGFKKMGAAMKALKAQASSDAPAKPVMAAAAAAILETARMQGPLFPPGSGASPGIKTDALPAIWTDKAKFDSNMATLVSEAGKLVATVNGGNKDAIAAQTKAVGGTCAACHRQFRQDT
jgi:cytochrome c556